MSYNFVFSIEHLIILFFVAIFLFLLPSLTKNLLPYSYLVEKIICISFLFITILEQMYLISSQHYNVLYTLPISITDITIYLCIAIFIFKKYHLFNVFFSWSIVCSIGDLIFFKDLLVEFPNILYFFYILSRLLILYSLVYLIKVRKFSINSKCLTDNLKACFLFFMFTYLLNKFYSTNYNYSFSSSNFYIFLLFVLITSITYVPILFNDNNNFIYKFKRKNKL